MPPAKNNYTVIFENDDFVALNKPSGMLSIPNRAKSEVSLKEKLETKYGKIFPVHRLDRDTSGIILFAKNADFHRYMSQLFEHHKVEKYYTGIVSGRPIEETGDIEAPIAEHPTIKGTMVVHRNGKPSHTSFRVFEGHHAFSMVLFRLHTGRTHQIRVHAKNIGHPLACDPLYGDGLPVFLSAHKKGYKSSKKDEEKPMISRLALHASKLIFDDHGQRREMEAPVPKEFSALLKQLKKKG